MHQDFRRDVRKSRVSFFGVRHIVAATAVLALIASSASAVPINYGDKIAADVVYTQVTEASNSIGDTPPLFGTPGVFGNSLDFTPVGFSASANGAGGSDITDGQLTFGIEANPGKAIFNVQITEFGDTTLTGIGTDNTMTVVTGLGNLNIHEVDGVGINVVTVPINISFNPSGGTFGLGTDGGGGPNFNSQWTGIELLDVQQALVDNNIPFTLGATRVSVSFNNTLTAVSQEGTAATIAKKDNIIITTNIPEPTTCAMALLALLASVGLAGRLR